jgi:hypothetical protein
MVARQLAAAIAVNGSLCRPAKKGHVALIVADIALGAFDLKPAAANFSKPALFNIKCHRLLGHCSRPRFPQ